jgi:hypothetical protein
VGFPEKVNYAPVAVLVVPVASIAGAIVPVASIAGVASVETVSTEPVATVEPVEVEDFIPGIVHAERRETRTRERAIAFIKEKIKK